jgi:CBS domain-containing protein
VTRTDIYLDAMLRHLGAAYYESRHGGASRTDVKRALLAVEEHVREQPGPSQPGATPAHGQGQPRSRHWARRVQDVMTTTVVTVDQSTPYKEIARLLADNRISGVPVLSTGQRVVGMVTEANLLADEEKRAWERIAVPGHGLRPQRHWALTAGELMSSPAITIRPDATIAHAAHVMNEHHVRRLPVVDEDGCLLGIVSRRDLLSVFLRPDADVAAEIREIFDEVLHADPGTVTITVTDGVVVLTGPRDADRDLVTVAARLAWGVDGVITVIDRRGALGTNTASPDGGTKPAAAAHASAPSRSS